jgi:hypothetical protein
MAVNMAKKIKLPYKMLIYDCETAPLQCYVWRLGEQVVRHPQLSKGRDQYNIITIAYKWFGEKETHVLDWGYKQQNSKKMIEKFDKLVRQADVVLGKNSDSFDAKHINAQRMLHGLKPLPEWINISDDLEKQLRRYFAFPSQSLDYVSKLLGFGGKDKMEMSDWIDIVEKNGTAGLKAFAKMKKYNKKDVEDTEAVLRVVLPHVKLRKNAAAEQEGKGCSTCGSMKIVPTKIITCGQTRYQQFDCLEHEGYAGKATLRYDKARHKVFGKIS